MQTLKPTLASPKPWRFLIVGIGNMVVGLASIYIFSALGSSEVLANAIGYLCGLTLSYILNRRWTFKYTGDLAGSAFRFTFVFVIAYLCNLGVVLFLLDELHLNHYAAQALGIPPYTLLFYLGSKYFAFRTSDRSRQAIVELRATIPNNACRRR